MVVCIPSGYLRVGCTCGGIHQPRSLRKSLLTGSESTLKVVCRLVLDTMILSATSNTSDLTVVIGHTETSSANVVGILYLKGGKLLTEITPLKTAALPVVWRAERNDPRNPAARMSTSNAQSFNSR